MPGFGEVPFPAFGDVPFPGFGDVSVPGVIGEVNTPG